MASADGRSIFASGAALFSDGYANAAIGPAGHIFKTRIYPDHFAGPNGSRDSSLISSMAFAGIIVGQLSFGYISDKVGRKFGMLLCTAIVFVFSALCAASKGPSVQGTVNALIAYRFLVGIGIGGEYPTGSVAAAENTEDSGIKKRSQQKLFVLATNTMLDLAFVVAYLVCLALLKIFGENHLNAVWRTTLGLGVVPPMILMYFRLKMKEPEAYAKNSMKHARIPYWLLIKRYWLKLLAVSITWFIYDWITYPFGIYASTITDQVIPNASLYQNIAWGTLINVSCTLRYVHWCLTCLVLLRSWYNCGSIHRRLPWPQVQHDHWLAAPGCLRLRPVWRLQLLCPRPHCWLRHHVRPLPVVR